VSPTEQDLLAWRRARASEPDPARRAELDLGGAQVLWSLQGPGAARAVYEQLVLHAPPAQAAQACAQLGALELQQGRAAAALLMLERALAGALPEPLRPMVEGNRALAAAVLEASPVHLAALDAAAQALERAGDLEGAAALRRNRARLSAPR
jgi:tetratricopeptide (TPR) repeat protein